MANKVEEEKDRMLLTSSRSWFDRIFDVAVLAIALFIIVTALTDIWVAADMLKKSGAKSINLFKLGLNVVFLVWGIYTIILAWLKSTRRRNWKKRHDAFKVTEVKILHAILQRYTPSSSYNSFHVGQIPLSAHGFPLDSAWMVKSPLSESSKHVDLFTPDSMPPIGETQHLADDWLDEFLDFKSEKTSVEQERIFYWTLMMQMNQERAQMLQLFKVSSQCIVSFGFLPLNQKGVFEKSGPKMVFGIIVNLLNAANDASAEASATSPLIDTLTILETLQIGEYRFPVMLKTIDYTPHCTEPHPINGTTACYAKQSSEDDKLQILTSKHVTGTNIGAKIQLTCGKHGKLTHLGPDGVDAAMVSIPDCTTKKTLALKTARYIVAYSDVTIRCQNGRMIPATISSITDSKGLFKQNLIPIRIFLNKHGAPGDSGSLVTNQQGNAVGLYMGAAKSKSRVTEGIVQHVAQVTGTMDIQLYK